MAVERPYWVSGRFNNDVGWQAIERLRTRRAHECPHVSIYLLEELPSLRGSDDEPVFHRF